MISGYCKWKDLSYEKYLKITFLHWNMKSKITFQQHLATAGFFHLSEALMKMLDDLLSCSFSTTFDKGQNEGKD